MRKVLALSSATAVYSVSCATGYTVSDFLLGSCVCSTGQLFVPDTIVSASSYTDLGLLQTDVLAAATATAVGCVSTAHSSTYCLALSASPGSALTACRIATGPDASGSTAGRILIPMGTTTGSRINKMSGSAAVATPAAVTTYAAMTVCTTWTSIVTNTVSSVVKGYLTSCGSTTGPYFLYYGAATTDLSSTVTYSLPPCSNGYTSSSGACTICATGTSTNQAGLGYCNICATNYYGTVVSGAGSAASCTACSAGTEGSSTVSLLSSQATSGTYNSDSTYCIDCTGTTPSLYSIAGGSCASSCPAGYTTPSGTYSSSNKGSCTKCATGTYSTAGATGCFQCAAGYYGATVTSGTASCTACAAGKYSTQGSNSASSSCTSCSTGTYSLAGSASCNLCAAGYYGTSLDAGYTASCTQCGSNTFNSYHSQQTSSACLACPSNAYSSSSTSTVYCLECPANYYGTVLSGSTNIAAATDHNSCTPCAANTYRSGVTTSTKASTDCSACSTGTYSVAGESCSASCPEGYITPTTSNGLTACAACATGTWSTAGASVCQTCAAGYYGAAATGTNTANCTACASGTAVATTGSTTVSSCVACATGTNTTSAGSAYCTTCAPGYRGHVSSVSAYNTTKTAQCFACGSGKYATVGSTSCTSCPANSTVLGTQGGCKCNATNAIFSSGVCSCATGYTLVNGVCTANSSSAVSAFAAGVFSLLATFILLAGH